MEYFKSNISDGMKKKLQQSAYSALISNSMLPKSILENEVKLLPENDHDAECFKRLKEIEENIYDRAFSNASKKHLLICSANTGNGKTSWATRLLKSYCLQDSFIEYQPYEQDYNLAVYIPTTRFVNFSKSYDIPEYRKQYFKMREAAENAAIVVFDDIGVADYSKAEYTALLEIVDTRVFDNKMCIFTSNLTKKTEKVAEKLGKRLADRIFDTSEIIEFTGRGVRH